MRIVFAELPSEGFSKSKITVYAKMQQTFMGFNPYLPKKVRSSGFSVACTSRWCREKMIFQCFHHHQNFPLSIVPIKRRQSTLAQPALRHTRVRAWCNTQLVFTLSLCSAGVLWYSYGYECSGGKGWRNDDEDIEISQGLRQVRNPWPGAYSSHTGPM